MDIKHHKPAFLYPFQAAGTGFRYMQMIYFTVRMWKQRTSYVRLLDLRSAMANNLR